MPELAEKPQDSNPKDAISQENLELVMRYIREVEHGTVTLIIQDHRVIRAEKTEKIKFA